MLTLGIGDGHDAGACLLENGKLLAAVSEERLTGRKRQPGFPYAALHWCLESIGAKPADVTALAVAERSGRALHRLLDARYRRTDPNLPMNRLGNRLSSAVQNRITAWSALAAADRRLAEAVLRRRFRRLGFTAPLTLVDHHLAHAMSAAKGSGFAAALVLTQDAYGDGLSGSVARWSDGRLEFLARIPYPHSPALLYGLTAALLGFAEGEEGKVAGLAATGDPRVTRLVFDRLLTHADGVPYLNAPRPFTALRRALAGYSPADIAAGLQLSVEANLTRLVEFWLPRAGADRLCLAGGLFANVRLNQILADAGGARDLFVFPHMGDGGLCAGAGWVVDPALPTVAMSPFLGPEAARLPAEALADEAWTVRPLDAAAVDRAATAIHAGAAVALVQGPLEFGPRALGNRSILFSARSPEIAARWNRALGRPDIMPFAPVASEADLPLVTDSPRRLALEHMTATVTAREGIAARFPVAVHADGTMRLQIARPATTPLLHDLLAAYSRHMNPAMTINTSFNRHTEPIVAGTDGALELFRRLPLAMLLLPGWCLEKRDGGQP
ncbi:MAG: hypothetical protein GX444_10155 [Myxococcales bacterium]|nr:hypothetical protein [Myxococcales bacterium]